MDNLIERNKSYKEFKHSNDIIKLKQSSERHDKNMYEEQKKLEEKALKNEEKILRRYMTFYYYKKNIEKEQKLKNTRNQHKLIEKCEKLEVCQIKQFEIGKPVIKLKKYINVITIF